MPAQPCPTHAEVEHGAAEHHGVVERRALDVLDHPRQSRPLEERPRRPNQIGVFTAGPHCPEIAIRLAWWARMDHIEPPRHPIATLEDGEREHRHDFQRVELDELKRVMRLRLDVHAHDLKPYPVVSHRSPSGPAEQIQEPGSGGGDGITHGVGSGVGMWADPSRLVSRLTKLPANRTVVAPIPSVFSLVPKSSPRRARVSSVFLYSSLPYSSPPLCPLTMICQVMLCAPC